MGFKRFSFPAWLAVIFFLSVNPATAADRLKKIEDRLQKIEESQRTPDASYDENSGQVRSFIAKHLTLGGFFETGITGIFGPDTDTQVSANSHILGINLTADLAERFRFVNQTIVGLSFPLQNPHNNPVHGFVGLPTKRDFGGFAFGAVVTQGYMEYTHTDLFKVQAGLGYVPFGIAYQQREPVLFLRRNGPQLSTAADNAGGVGVASALWTGLHFLGNAPIGKTRIGYDVYSVTPISDVGMVGGGSRVWWSDSTRVLTLGVSQQTADRGNDTYFAFGGDAKLEMRRWGVAAEYGRQFKGGPDIWSFYAEPYVTFFDERFVVFADADYLDNAIATTARAGVNVNDPYKKLIYGGGVNYLPLPTIRTRLHLLVHDYLGATAVIAGQDRDYYALELSMGVAF